MQSEIVKPEDVKLEAGDITPSSSDDEDVEPTEWEKVGLTEEEYNEIYKDKPAETLEEMEA